MHPSSGGSIRFDNGVTAAGAAGADISSLLSGERRRFQLASLNIEQTAKPSHPSTDSLSPVPSNFRRGHHFSAGDSLRGARVYVRREKAKKRKITLTIM